LAAESSELSEQLRRQQRNLHWLAGNTATKAGLL